MLKQQWVRLQTLVVDTALEAVAPAAQAKRHELHSELQDPLQWVYADPVRLAQVLSNLLNNAAKYTDPGRLHHAGRAGRRRLAAAFAVADNGIGMSADALQNVFAMFAQEQAALERSEGGLGIGLALAKGLVELHGGSIRAESAGPGRGSRFEVRLPRAERAEEAEPAAGSAGAAQGPGRTVLLADDNADAAEVLAELLRLAGHDVRVASDGHAAADLAARLQPQVLVLDIGMPGLNGYEVARQVRAQSWGPGSLLIAATGWGQEEDRRKALQAGFDLHFTKPFSPEQLLEAIARRTPR